MKTPYEVKDYEGLSEYSLTVESSGRLDSTWSRIATRDTSKETSTRQGKLEQKSIQKSKKGNEQRAGAGR